MHMADALISPAVGGTMWAAAAGMIALSSGRLKHSLDDHKIPLMGVLGAFIFAAQMINFAIPGTGASGHLGGGMILAILLGPAAGFIVMASVLTVQALFFADGGLLALGSNIVNLGAVTCFVAYPLIFRPLWGRKQGQVRLFLACILSAVFALQLGSLGVVAETTLSGIADLSFGSFLLLMQPIHLLIGLMEGIVTAVVVNLIWKSRPETLPEQKTVGISRGFCGKQILVSLLVMTLLCGGLLSGFASTDPDGLEWAVERAMIGEGKTTSANPEFENIQQKTAFLPGYAFRKSEVTNGEQMSRADRVETSISGLVGGSLTLFLIVLGGVLMSLWQQRSDRMGSLKVQK